MELRDYQKAALEQIDIFEKKGVKKQVAILATGLGKTVIFSHLIAKRIKHKKALILAHREELLLQAKEKLLHIEGSINIGIEQGEKTVNHRADDVVIASVSTIGKTGSQRLDAFNVSEYGTIIIDEAHHASAASYKNVLRHFGVLKNEADWNKDILLVGFTATPQRNDNRGIDRIFDEVVYEYPIIAGIENGWLVPIRSFQIDTEIDISSVSSLQGDFTQSELAKTVNITQRNNLIVKTYKEKAYNQKTLIFAVDIAHTKALQEAFMQAGIKAVYVTGETNEQDRKNRLADFATGETMVMINAMVLTEGYDNAAITHIFMSRPTQSGILYQQMIGRGTRLHTNKAFLTIIDFVDNTTKHELQTAASLIGLKQLVQFNGNDILLAKRNIDRLLEKRPYFDLRKLNQSQIDYLIAQKNAAEQKLKEEQQKPYHWHDFGPGIRMFTSDEKYYYIEQSLTNQYVLYEFLQLLHKKNKIAEFLSKSEAMQYAGTHAVKTYTHFGNQLQPTTDIPTQAQLTLLRELGVDETTLLFLDRKSASNLISERKKRR